MSHSDLEDDFNLQESEEAMRMLRSAMFISRSQKILHYLMHGIIMMKCPVDRKSCTVSVPSHEALGTSPIIATLLPDERMKLLHMRHLVQIHGELLLPSSECHSLTLPTDWSIISSSQDLLVVPETDSYFPEEAEQLQKVLSETKRHHSNRRSSSSKSVEDRKKFAKHCYHLARLAQHAFFEKHIVSPRQLRCTLGPVQPLVSEKDLEENLITSIPTYLALQKNDTYLSALQLDCSIEDENTMVITTNLSDELSRAIVLMGIQLRGNVRQIVNA